MSVHGITNIKPQTDQSAIDAFLASGRTITRCPTMAAGSTKVKLSYQDLKAMKQDQYQFRNSRPTSPQSVIQPAYNTADVQA